MQRSRTIAYKNESAVVLRLGNDLGHSPDSSAKSQQLLVAVAILKIDPHLEGFR